MVPGHILLYFVEKSPLLSRCKECWRLSLMVECHLTRSSLGFVDACMSSLLIVGLNKYPSFLRCAAYLASMSVSFYYFVRVRAYILKNLSCKVLISYIMGFLVL